jgi:hypothetical protein
MLTISEGFYTVYIYGDDKKGYFRVTLVKLHHLREQVRQGKGQSTQDEHLFLPFREGF